MNKQRLLAAESEFLTLYPGGFSHPLMVREGKKHQIAQRTAQAQQCFAPECFSRPQQVAEDMIKLISRSSMISMFEKPRLRDWVRAMTHHERESYAFALNDMLHGDQEYGFNIMLDLLRPARLAKWSLMTILPYYYAPRVEVFVKPTTTKGVIRFFELQGLVYNPTPSYPFYTTYREQIIEMRNMVDASLQQDNAAFTGFLMMSTKTLG
ncbi:hypothetical protein [Oceanimonas sp. MB9]|uniref:hypothetical protein n=1 Tax=Oceanimonas sp. MB9 TaxID=2588453 RepID=UPI0013F63EBB|nr:hypothetical protein [Oceanimonas sp. MB9]NHI00262.1 hypothetical protein [Oceanimonas sp. MB9]